MRAVVVDAEGSPRLQELPEPSGDGELFRVRACGLCGSDVEKLQPASAGAVLGHEVVAERGDGRRVVLVHHLPCGDCERCTGGHESTCDEFRAATIEPGGFAEHVRGRAAVELATGIDDAVATFAEPLACVLRAAERVPSGRVLVVGCGFVGLLFVQVLRRRGDEVFVADPLEERRAVAHALGARDLDGQADAAVLAAPGGMDDALGSVEPGGTVVVFAAPPEPAPVDLDSVYRRELTVVGSRSATPRHVEQAVALLPELEPLPTLVLPLARFEEGLAAYRSRRALKVVFTP